MGLAGTLDGQMLILSASLWLTHFVFMVSKDYPAGLYHDAGTTTARLITAVAGALISWCLYLLLKRKTPRAGLDRFLSAVIYSLPACALLTLINEFAFSRLSGNYLAHPELFMNRGEYIFTFSFFLWIFVAWAALYTTLSSGEQLREQERRLAAADAAASTAQLKALQLQIHPHFLFNTLNTLSGLVGAGRKVEAERMILNLSEFLRRTLATPPNQFVLLQEEFDVQRQYLDIESMRFADRLCVEFNIEPGCDQALTPALILQPLVENAIKHALSRSEGAVTIRLSARREGQTLRLSVRDIRAGDAERVSAGFGIGLVNVRDRLAVLFGDRARFSAAATSDGWLSEIVMPWMVA